MPHKLKQFVRKQERCSAGVVGQRPETSANAMRMPTEFLELAHDVAVDPSLVPR